jgi:acyl-CoA synthetase (AMP-forming)/AMP-acid ligase II
MNVAELLTIPASIIPDETIICFDAQTITYAALLNRVSAMRAALSAAGVRAGDRVAVLETSTPSVLDVLFATTSLGATFVPLNVRARSDELSSMLSVAVPRLLVVGDRYVDLARQVVTAISDQYPIELATLDSPCTDLRHLSGAAQTAEDVEPEEVADDDLAVLMFTSGTTARAKAAMLAHADLATYVLEMTEPPDGSARGVLLLAAPLYHIAGLMAVLTAIFAGRRIVLPRQFDGAEWLHLVARERVTNAFLVPTMLKRVLDQPAFSTTDLSSLEVLSYGAAPMPLGLIRRAIDAFPSTVQFINAFGQTETTSTVTMLAPDDHRLEGTPAEVEAKLRRLGSVGRALPDVEIRILDEQGQEQPPNCVGEVVIRSDRLMRGYYGQDDATQETLQDGWLHTRDLGWQDEAGYLFLAGRKSDMIIRGGENVAPEEVELVLELHPSVEEAVVFGLPDDEWGERVAAMVVPRPSQQVSPAALVEFCRQRLASFKTPDTVFIGLEVPRNTLGKVLRKELRATYAGHGSTEER